MLISKTGDYITRNGSKVTIHTINDKATATANCKGAIWRVFRGKFVPRGYAIWCDSGNYRFLGAHPLDIVGIWQE